MRTIIISLFVVTSLFWVSCGKNTKTIEQEGGSIVTVRFYDVVKNGETHEDILKKLKARAMHLSKDAQVYYSAIDSTYQISLPDFYSERNLKLLISKGEININMLWHHSEFQKPHGQRLIAELRKKYKVSQQEVDFLIEDVNFSDISEISKYIKDKNLLDGFPKETSIYWKAPSVTGRENKVALFLLSESPDNFNLNVATDSSEVTESKGRNSEFYTKLFLNGDYKTRYADISDRNVGNQVAISIDQYVVSTPIIDSRVDTGVITSVAGYDYEGHMVFEALLSTEPIKSPSEIISLNVISNHKKDI